MSRASEILDELIRHIEVMSPEEYDSLLNRVVRKPSPKIQMDPNGILCTREEPDNGKGQKMDPKR